MRSLMLALGLLSALALPSLADDQPGPNPAALHKRLAALEEQIATLQREAGELRQQLDKLAPPRVAILSPQEAVEAFKKNPGQPVTVEFGVEPGSAGSRTGLGPDDLIWATWDNRLVGGGSFSAILFPEAYVGLTIPAKEKGQAGVKPPPGGERALVGRHIDVNGLRVTGLIRQRGEASWRADYYIVVDDPTKVVLYHSIAPRPLPRP